MGRLKEGLEKFIDFKGFWWSGGKIWRKLIDFKGFGGQVGKFWKIKKVFNAKFKDFSGFLKENLRNLLILKGFGGQKVKFWEILKVFNGFLRSNLNNTKI